MKSSSIKFFCFARFSFAAYYVQQCSRDSADLNGCLRNSANRLAKFLRQGVPELGIEDVSWIKNILFFIMNFQILNLGRTGAH